MTLYLLSLKTQEELIRQRCFCDCGEISIGVVLIDGFGTFISCRKDDCPYLDNQMDLGAEVLGKKPVYEYEFVDLGRSKISEVIALLQRYKDKYGDVECYSCFNGMDCDVEIGYWHGRVMNGDEEWFQNNNG